MIIINAFQFFFQFSCIRLQLLMERQATGNSIVHDLYNYSISRDFLDVQHYKQTQESNRKGAFFYQGLCQKLESYYKLILEIPNSCTLYLQEGSELERWQLKNFKNFLRKLFEIFNLVSEYQIGSFSTIRNSQVQFDSFDFTFHKFVTSIEKYASQQQNLKTLQQKYKILFEQLQVHEKYLNKKIEKPHYCFNMTFVSNELKSFQEKFNQKDDIENQITELIDKIGENNKQFQKDFMFLKQKFIMNKYEYIEKINKMCKHSKQSLMEIVTYLLQYFQKNDSMFKMQKSGYKERNPFKNSDPKVRQNLITSQTSEYCRTLNQYSNIIKQLINSFVSIAEIIKEWKNNQHQYVEILKKFYEYNECDVGEVQMVLNLYHTFLRILSELGDKFVFSLNNINQLEKKVRKCSEMTLTLSKHKRRKSSVNIKDKSQAYIENEDQTKYLQILHEQMNPNYIEGILTRIYADFGDAFNKIKNSFLDVLPNKRKKVQNSMSISHISELSSPIERRPSRTEIWLWRNWRSELKKDFLFSQELDRLLKQLITISQEFKKKDKEIDTLTCVFKAKKFKGVLKLREKSLLFESEEGSYFIPFKQIESIDMQMKMISKTLSVETTIGALQFQDLTEDGIKKFYVSVHRTLDVFRQSNDEKPSESNKVVLSEEELEYIKKRRIDIDKDLQKVQDYNHFLRVLLSDIDLVDVYKVLYSGDPVVLNGKEYQNFQASLSKKYQNFNDVYGKYDRPGPCYFSGDEQTTFMNCPLFSKRVIEYDHKMPKVPLLPQSCHNVQNQFVYWISPQELHVKIVSIISKAPFVQNFNMLNLITLKQVGQDVEINYHYFIKELKDFSFKSSIYSKSIDQMSKSTDMLVEQLKKILVKYRKKASNGNLNENNGEAVDQSLNSQKTIIKNYKKTVKGLEVQVKYLKYALAFVFILNIVLLCVF